MSQPNKSCVPQVFAFLKYYRVHIDRTITFNRHLYKLIENENTTSAEFFFRSLKLNLKLALGGLGIIFQTKVPVILHGAEEILAIDIKERRIVLCNDSQVCS